MSGGFLRYFMHRAAYDAMRQGLRTASRNQTHPRIDYIPAVLPIETAKPGLDVIWLREGNYPVAGRVVRTGIRGVCIIVTRGDGSSVERWVDPAYLTTPFSSIASG